MFISKKFSQLLAPAGMYAFHAVWVMALLVSLSCTRQSSNAVNPGITLCGTVQFSETCGGKTDSLIAYGLALTHHMTYDEAERQFDTVIKSSPDCFWGYWGKAFTFIHPLWPDQPSQEKLMDGQELITKALSLVNSPREKAFGNALSAYYKDGTTKTEKERLKAMEVSWAEGFNTLPEDLEVKAWYALSLVSTADATDKSYKNQLTAGQLAQEVLWAIPGHPGGFHYTIHAYDYPELADKAIAAAKNYSDIAPDVPHALHMPTHIFTRRGMWDESVDWNMRSAKAAMKERVEGKVSYHYFHAVDYIVYAHLQQLEDNKANAIVNEYKSVEQPYQDSPVTAYTLSAVDGRLAMERSDWKKAASIVPRQPDFIAWDRYPEYEAITHFAIGLGAARSGQLQQAENTVKRLGELKEKTSNSYWASQVEVQKNTVNAWLQLAKGNNKEALNLMTQAAEQENATNKHPITPGELLTASELLGEMLLEMKKPTDALIHFEKALSRSPLRFNCLYGAALSAELAGDAEKARTYYNSLVEVSNNAEVTSEKRNRAVNYLAIAGSL